MKWSEAVEKTVAEFLSDRDMRRFESVRYPASITRPQSVVLDLRAEPVPGNHDQRQLRVTDMEYADDFYPFVVPGDPETAEAIRSQIEQGQWSKHDLPKVLVVRFINRLFEIYYYGWATQTGGS